jgi:hypothetical protein
MGVKRGLSSYSKGGMVLRNVDILPQHYMALQPIRPGLGPSVYVLPLVLGTKFHTHTEQRKIIFLCILIFKKTDAAFQNVLTG